MKTYRTGFIWALAGNAALVALLVLGWLHYRTADSKVTVHGQSADSAAQMPVSNSGSSAATPQETRLAPVQMSAQRLQGIGVKFGQVQRKSVDDEIGTTANVAVDETKLAYVQVRFSGYIQHVFVDAAYQYVHKGQPLFTIYSPDLVATEREYLVAKQNQQEVSRSTVSGVATGAASLVTAAVERLSQWGIPQKEIARLETTGRVQQELEIDSPATGYVTERNALPGLTVQPETRLYTIANLSTVWVQAQVFQNDLGRIKVGDPAELTVDSYPGRTFHGRLDFIYPNVDMNTRTANVRIVFSNPELLLTPGMFVNVTLRIPMGRRLVIPASGVLQSGTRSIAFVDRGDGYLDPRDVELGARVGDDFIVLKGLKVGERIATSANFLIDSESQLQAALGSFVPPPSGAGAAAAINAPQTNIEFSSNPNPPHKGSNVFHVKLTSANGSPVSGAQVTVTFFMPAMPAMGMAAMRTTVTLTDKAGGNYGGSGQLGSGGTWQVTILAQKNGKTIGSKQLSITAAGGM